MMLGWLQGQETLWWWLGAISALTFVSTAIALPLVVARIPTDYFLRDRRYVSTFQAPLTPLRLCALIARNLLGILLVCAGIAMLLLPGQGILTILVGLMLLNFPGKYAFEQRLVQQPSVLRALNWMRAKARRPPLQVPPRESRGQAEGKRRARTNLAMTLRRFLALKESGRGIR